MWNRSQMKDIGEEVYASKLIANKCRKHANSKEINEFNKMIWLETCKNNHIRMRKDPHISYEKNNNI